MAERSRLGHKSEIHKVTRRDPHHPKQRKGTKDTNSHHVDGRESAEGHSEGPA